MYIKDINLIRSFWAVAESGSFSEAARKLGSTQPTLTRQIQALEQQTGLHLFERSNKGLTITEAGARLVEVSGHMMESVDAFNRAVAGQDDHLEGDVRISANEIIGYFLLPGAIAALRQAYPAIQIEIDINNSFASLSQRDADIAFRMAEPSQPDLVRRSLPSLPLGIYGTRQLIEEHGRPESPEHLLQLPFIGFDKEPLLIDALHDMGLDAHSKHFAVRTDSLLAQITLARAGAGFCIVQRPLALQFPELVPVLEDVPLPKLPFWLVCHSDIQYSKKINAVMRFLGEWFSGEPYKHSLV